MTDTKKITDRLDEITLHEVLTLNGRELLELSRTLLRERDEAREAFIRELHDVWIKFGRSDWQPMLGEVIRALKSTSPKPSFAEEIEEYFGQFTPQFEWALNPIIYSEPLPPTTLT